MRSEKFVFLLGACTLFHAPMAYADQDTSSQSEQVADTATIGTSDIIVQARRRGELEQDVPLVVNAVTSESIQKLNLREFKDIETLVPGLSLGGNANGIGAMASLRGVAYDVNASGNNGTIEFYMNDSPLSAGVLFQSMFDVGQIEVLRGPQGTLRGRASPSGSVTVTTRRPDLYEVGANATATVNDISGWNLNGAFNIPIFEEKFAIRLAGVRDENEGNRVRSIYSDAIPSVITTGGRITLLAEPVEWLSLMTSYTETERKIRQFDQVESASLVDNILPASGRLIRAKDRLSVERIPREIVQNFKVFNWQAEAILLGQKLNYVGSNTKQKLVSLDPNDKGGVFGTAYPDALRMASQETTTDTNQTSHELRLSNDERLFGMFDYSVGGLHNKLVAPTYLTIDTPLFAGILIPQSVFPNLVTPDGLLGTAQFAQIVKTPVERFGHSVEKSLFANLTAHVGPDTELSGGARYIHYKSQTGLVVDGDRIEAADDNSTTSTWIYSASAKHRFNRSLMLYASLGTSWRPGSSTNSVVLRDNVAPTSGFASLYRVGDEKSQSYELGLKSDWFDNRLKFNLTAFHQDFKNFAFSSREVYYAIVDAQGVERSIQAPSGIAVGVPVKVNGIEAEIAFQPTSRWNISLIGSYAKSTIKNGSIPCNDYNPRDGKPDGAGPVPTYEQIVAANGGEQIAFCSVDYRAGIQAPFSGNVQSEYILPMSGKLDGYVRGLLNYQGKSRGDPANSVDDISAYALVNLFAGVRASNGGWEIGLFAKNLFDTQRVLTREARPASVSYQQLNCTRRDPRLVDLCPPDDVVFGQNAVSSYRNITMTQPREFGITLRMAIGSR